MLDADNRLFALAREGERQPSILVAITVTIVTLAVTIVGGQMLARIIFHTIPWPEPSPAPIRSSRVSAG